MRSEKKSAKLPSKMLSDSGTIEHRYVRCGRPNCKCTKGELHGAYTYVRFYRNGKRWRRYVKNSDVSTFLQLREQRRQRLAEAKQAQAEFLLHWRELKSLLRSLGV